MTSHFFTRLYFVDAYIQHKTIYVPVSSEGVDTDHVVCKIHKTDTLSTAE